MTEFLQKDCGSKNSVISTVHSVEITENYSHAFFGKKFVKTTHLLNKLLKSWFDGKNFGESEFFIFPQCVLDSLYEIFVKSFYSEDHSSQCEKTRNSLPRKISSNQFTVKFFDGIFAT